MTVLFIKDVIERFSQKASFIKEIAAVLNFPPVDDITTQVVRQYNNKSIAIGGCDAVGRCDKKLLLDPCKSYDVVIMPCIGGRNEYEAKQELSKLDCTVIDIDPPRIRLPKHGDEHTILRMFASAIAQYITQIH